MNINKFKNNYKKLDKIDLKNLNILESSVKNEIITYKLAIKNYPEDRYNSYAVPHLNSLNKLLTEIQNRILALNK